ncbi:lipopolysaccharide biosynthesis protein [Nocardioides marmoraquaticus]
MTRSDSTTAGARAPWYATGTVMAVALVVMNVSTYGYTMVAARLLGPGPYGAFAAVMGLLLVLSVLQLGLQTTGARRVAAEPGSVAAVERSVVRVSVGASAVLTVVCLAFSPLIDGLLRLGSLPTALLVAVTAFPMTLMGGQAGILQGERRWTSLALLYVAAGLPRLVIGTLLLLVEPSESMATLGVAVAFWAPVLVGWWALRRSAHRRVPTSTGDHSAGQVLRETFRNSHALLAFLALSNADIIVARDVLDAHDAGLYAGGLILVKAVLFLPQFVVIVAFPTMSEDEERRGALLRSLALILVLGAGSVLASWLLSRVALVFVGGPQYVEIQDRLWLFAILGTVLAMLQLLVYGVVARQARRAVYAVWAGLVAVVALSRGVGDATDLALVVLAVDSVVLAVLLVAGLRRDTETTAEVVEPQAEPARRP